MKTHIWDHTMGVFVDIIGTQRWKLETNFSRVKDNWKMWRTQFSGAQLNTAAIEVATLGSCEFMEVADGQACKKPNKPQTLAFYMYKATRLRRRLYLSRHSNLWHSQCPGGSSFSRQLALIIRRSSTRREVWVPGLVWTKASRELSADQQTSAILQLQCFISCISWAS